MSLDREVFLRASEIMDAQQREDYLEEACPDGEFRARIEAMLAFDPDETFLHEKALPPAQSSNRDLRPAVLVGTKIGRYRLVSVIGEGGFGVVYEAEQMEPVQRTVALKIVKLGMDTEQVIRRFETERQVLALMDHPSIAKVFDGGATDKGRPYFVMEVVDGVPITDYCDQHKLVLLERLRLMSQVCRGVQHAHQKGIIHRDVKPSNVLVSSQDGAAVPKIIDFGVAKATQRAFTERSYFTETQQFIGTPSYMSPEQTGWSEVDVDTRSDVYSLGVLLYELLTGTTPITDETLRRSAFDEVCRLIREDTFPLPSSRISSLGIAITTVADSRGSSERQLREKTRGELDWIVMKAIEKDRNRRYDSAADFATDIDNFLDQKPIQAAPPSFSYRTKKYLQRNWKFAALISALAASLIIGTVLSVGGFVTASRELERSRRNLYASDVSLSGQAMRVGNGRLAEEFLLNHVESHPAKDLRTFPWRYMMRQLNQHEAVLAHGSPVHDVFFAENDRYIVSTGEAGRVIVWDAKTRKQLRLIESQISSVKAATMIGESLYVGGRSKKSLVSPGAIELWNWNSGEKVETIRLDVDFESILHLRPIPNSDCLLIASLNQVVAYDVVRRCIAWQVNPETTGRAAASQTRAVGISHDGTRIATSIPLGRPTEGETGLFLLDATNGQRQVSLPHIPSIRTISFSRDNSQVAVGQILPTNQQPLRLIDLAGNAAVTLNTNLAVESAAFSPVGNLLATLNWRGQLMFWNTESGEQMGNVPAHANAPGNLGFSSDGEFVVTCGQDGNVKLWKVSDVLAPQAVAATQPGGTVNWYAFSNDGQSFVSSALMPPTIQHPKRWNVALLFPTTF